MLFRNLWKSISNNKYSSRVLFSPILFNLKRCSYALEIPAKYFTPVIFRFNHAGNAKSNELESLDYYRNYMTQNAKKYSLLSKDSFDFESDSNKNFVKLLKQLRDTGQSDPKFEIDIIKCLEDELANANAEDVFKAMILCSDLIYAKASTSEFEEKLARFVCEAIKDKPLTIEEILKLIYIYRITKLKHYKGIKKRLYRVLTKFNQLTSAQIVYFFYLVKSNLDLSDLEEKYKVQSCIYERIDEFNLCELAIIIRGFEKTKLKLTHCDFVKAIFQKLDLPSEDLDPAPVSIICRVLAQSLPSKELRTAVNFQNKIAQDLSKYDNDTALGFATLSMKYSYVDEIYLQALINKIKGNVLNLSSLNLVRLMVILSSMDVEDKEILEDVVKALEQVYDQPAHLVMLLSCLSDYRVYPTHFLDRVLCSEFLSQNILSSKAHLSYNAKFYWWRLYFNTEIEKPECIKLTLSNQARKRLFNMFYFSQANLHLFSRIVTKNRNGNFYLTLSKIFGENYVYRIHCLPHYERGTVMRFNKDLEPQPLPKELWQPTYGSPIKAPQDGYIWAYMNVLTTPNVCGSLEPMNAFRRTQKRQLEIMGYTPIWVNFILFKNILRNDNAEDKIKNLILEKVKNELLEKERAAST